ncbi:flagellar export protein FliJ [Nocardioides pyridinolyticus]
MSSELRLGGVVRVRRIRERDSRTGLSQAIDEEQRAADRVARITQQLAGLGDAAATDIAAFTARQHTVTALSEALTQARDALAAAHRITAAARDRWHLHSSRLAAVESLVERRESARRLAQRRREDRELDEIAQDLWRRTVHAEEVVR